jgi:serine/threonine-protein kinase
MRLPIRLGNYVLEEFLDGGETETYRARDTESGRLVVVEILSEEACSDAEARERFLAEAGEDECGESEDGQPFRVRELSPAAAPPLRIVSRKPVRPPRWRFPLGWMAAGLPAAILAGLAAAHYWPKPKAAAAPGPALAATLAAPSGDMVLVPAGTFLFGETKQQSSLPAFYIDRTEVTNAAYAAFSKATRHPLPQDFHEDRPDYPVVNVSMLDARAFAAWAGKRIPSGREWEKAARGEDGRAFPWGDQADRSRVNVGLALLLPANAFSKGASPYGALQMIGNAWEWVSDPHSPTDEEVESFGHRMNPPLASDELWYAVRGGGFDYPQLTPMLTWDSKSVPERWASDDIGFRCVKNAQ